MRWILCVVLYIAPAYGVEREMTVVRENVAQSDTWDLTPMYPSFSAWKQELLKEAETDYKALVAEYRNASHLTVSQVKSLYDRIFSCERRLNKLHTYAHLVYDQQIDNEESRVAFQQITTRYYEFVEEMSWVEPKILSHTLEELSAFCKAPELSTYSILLERLLRRKEHTLSEEQETLFAMSLRAMESSHKAFSMLTDADFHFQDIEDSEGNKRALTNASYGVLLRSFDRTLRKNAFDTMHTKYADFQNTICELLRGTVEQHFFESRARKFSSCLEAALHPHNIPTQVYKNLIATVRANVDVLHRYVRLKKQRLGVDKLYPWDLYVPLRHGNSEASYSYAEASELVLKAISPLGTAYVGPLSEGLLHKRWVDKYENKGKRSGAYSSGCYDSPPYILLNYKSILRDVFTLAHEAGHSMHSDFSHKHQPYHLASYSIFVAEVASTFNEELLAEELLNRFNDDPEELALLLNEKLEDLRATLFRQTLFAEFELFLHELVEKNEPFTPAVLNQKYRELNQFYYGDDLEIPESLGVEWARIPHFYYNFYVYQYATGVSAAAALSRKVLSGGDAEREAYLHFLQSGSSEFPIDLLRKAGVDMSSERPIVEAITYFSSLLDRYEKVCETLN
jgi:oligoendopeptidase F